jgi:hypothetical protein
VSALSLVFDRGTGQATPVVRFQFDQAGKGVHDHQDVLSPAG